MTIRERRQRDMGRRESGNFLRKHGDPGVVAHQAFGQLLVRPPQETDRRTRYAEHRQRRDRLAATSLAPTRALEETNVPASLEPTLRPRIVVAIGREHDTHACARGQRRLDQLTRSERFVIRMGYK